MGSMSPEATCFMEPGEAQLNFASHYDLENPTQAMSAYAR